MHRAALVALLLASSVAAANPVWITTDAGGLHTIHDASVPYDDGDMVGDVSMLRVDDDDLETIANVLHETTGRCGGFIAHDSREDAVAALRAKPPDKPAIDYTLDRAQLVREVLADLDRDKLLGTIRELSAMPSRLYKSPSGAAASIWLRDRWASYASGMDVTIELVDHGYPQKSVVLTIPGTTRKDEVVVIGGHLDSITFGSGPDAPGADDDASGIATMTEVLRALLANEYHPERTLVFVAYAAEEIGLRGSQGVVKLFQQRGINVVGALQLDMTNYQGSDKDIWLMKDFTSKPQNDFLIKLIETYTGATWGLDACGYACSDHASWYRAGVPASMPFEARMRERNMSIHSARDTLETSGNNADHAIKFARLAAAYAIELGKGRVMGAATEPTPAPAPPDRTWVLGVLGALAAAGMWLQRRVTR